MKKTILIALLAAALCSCVGKAGGGSHADDMSDSIGALIEENERLRQDQEDLLSTINAVEEGFRQINEAQGRMTMVRRGEGANTQARLREDMEYIKETMAQNAELIEKLRERLRENGAMSEQLQRTIDNLTAQMEQKNTEINQLRSELEAKNIRIDELETEAAGLHEDLSNLQQQNVAQDQTIGQQDRQLNRAWYCTGSKRELKDRSILRGGRVLQDAFDAAYFTEIDIRQVTQIRLNSKSADILTPHPAGSYYLEKGEDKMYTLYITDYQQFWSTSKYLVVQTK